MTERECWYRTKWGDFRKWQSVWRRWGSIEALLLWKNRIFIA